MNRNNNLIYFDNNQRTSIDAQVSQAMDKINPTFEASDEEVDTIFNDLEHQICVLLNCTKNKSTLITGYENALQKAINSTFDIVKTRGNHIISCKTESVFIIECLKKLEGKGAEVTWLNVDREGLIDLDQLQKSFKPSTSMVCITAVSSETGVFQPIEAIGKLCRENPNQPVFLCDGSQIVGKTRCDVEELGVDVFIFSSHTLYGPDLDTMITGVVYTNNGVIQNALTPSNEVNSPELNAAAGLSKAIELCNNNYWDDMAHVSKLRSYFEHQILDIEGLRINGSTKHRMYTTSNITFPDREKIIALKNKFKFSDNLQTSSHVLEAMGLTSEEIKSSFCFSFGRHNTLEEVKLVVEEIMN